MANRAMVTTDHTSQHETVTRALSGSGTISARRPKPALGRGHTTYIPTVDGFPVSGR